MHLSRGSFVGTQTKQSRCQYKYSGPSDAPESKSVVLERVPVVSSIAGRLLESADLAILTEKIPAASESIKGEHQ
jgi:hypothetical protein